jgi:carboxymethylenebutenolidase
MTITHHSLAVDGGDLPLTIARPGRDGAAVVIVPSAFGVGPDLEAQMEEIAADAGLVVSMDPFFRSDPGPAPYEDMKRVIARIQAIDRRESYDDVRTVIDWARAESGRSVVVVGICFGGPFALLAAADRLADGVVTWHGSRMDNYLERVSEMHCPMRLHFGGADPFVPMEAVDAVRRAFADHRDVEIVVHDGATHGFSHRGAKAAYDERAETAGMTSVRELARHA